MGGGEMIKTNFNFTVNVTKNCTLLGNVGNVKNLNIF